MVDQLVLLVYLLVDKMVDMLVVWRVEMMVALKVV
jgi:hypothetical protein